MTSHIGLTAANPTAIRPCMLETYVELSGGGYTTRALFRNIEVPNFSVSAVSDPVIRATRFWAFAQGAGAREWGTEQETSYGGQGHAAMTLRYVMAITAPSGAQSVSYYLSARMRALYLL